MPWHFAVFYAHSFHLVNLLHKQKMNFKKTKQKKTSVHSADYNYQKATYPQT